MVVCYADRVGRAVGADVIPLDGLIADTGTDVGLEVGRQRGEVIQRVHQAAGLVLEAARVRARAKEAGLVRLVREEVALEFSTQTVAEAPADAGLADEAALEVQLRAGTGNTGEAGRIRQVDLLVAENIVAGAGTDIQAVDGLRLCRQGQRQYRRRQERTPNIHLVYLLVIVSTPAAQSGPKRPCRSTCACWIETIPPALGEHEGHKWFWITLLQRRHSSRVREQQAR